MHCPAKQRFALAMSQALAAINSKQSSSNRFNQRPSHNNKSNNPFSNNQSNAAGLAYLVDARPRRAKVQPTKVRWSEPEYGDLDRCRHHGWRQDPELP
jgi:hypothetical protein